MSGMLQSMGSQRVAKSQNDLASEQQQHTTHPGGENPTHVSMPRWAPALLQEDSCIGKGPYGHLDLDGSRTEWVKLKDLMA